MYSEPIFSVRVPYRSLGQNLVSVPIPNQFFPVDLEPIPVRSRSQISRDWTTDCSMRCLRGKRVCSQVVCKGYL